MNRDADAYLSTRLDILAARLLPMSQLRELISLDLEQINNRLKALFPDYDLNAPITAQRRSINRDMYLDFQMLLRPFFGNDRRFLRHAVRWFELVNLKVIIRGKFTGVSETDLSRQLVELGQYADLPINALIETDDPFEMLRSLEQTVYGDIVRQARKVFEEQGHDLFSLDAAIDRNFFYELANRARFLDEYEQASMKKVLGVLLDRFNLLWLMRYRFSYGLTPAKSYYLLTATGPDLKSEQLMRLARVGSVTELVEELPPKLNSLLQGVQDIYQVEQLMELYSLSAARRGLGHQYGPITRLFAYLLLREAQTRYLLAILKGKHLGFEQPLIEQAIGVGS